MASEIRVNKIENRSGLGTVTFADTGVDLAGIVTATTFSGSGASLTALPAAQVTGTLPAISAANLTNIPAANVTGTLPAISALNLTNVPAANVVGVHTSLTVTNATTTGTAVVGGGVTISESGIEASGIGITVANINGGQVGGRRNLIINGGFLVAQRATTSTASNYGSVDRFRIVNSGTDEAAFTQKQVTDSPDEFSQSYEIDITTAESSLDAAEYFIIRTILEAQTLQGLAFGSSSAKPITLSFYVKAYQTGTYAASIYLDDTARAYTVNYTVNQSATWERKTITFAGDPSGGINNDNGVGCYINWHLAAGTDYTSSTTHKNQWASFTNGSWAHGQTVNVLSSTDNYWKITGVQLEIGSQATAFEHRSFTEELRLCQRYYYKHAFGSSEAGNLNISNNNMAVGMCAMYTSTAGFGFIPHPVTMRTLPTLDKATGTDYYRVYARGGADNFNDISTQQFGVNGSVINYYDGFARTQGDAGWIQCYNASAYIAFVAEMN